jgi:hypothetical protein
VGGQPLVMTSKSHCKLRQSCLCPCLGK